MLDFLEHLQKKPIHVRKRIALVVSIFITVIILILWLSIQSVNAPSHPIDGKALEEDLKPLNEIKKSSVDLFNTAKKVWSTYIGPKSLSTTTKS